MNPKTVQKTYTLEELVGAEQDWEHVFPKLPGSEPGIIRAGSVAFCGFVQPADVRGESNWENKPIHNQCPDCVRIARAKRGT